MICNPDGTAIIYTDTYPTCLADGFESEARYRKTKNRRFKVDWAERNHHIMPKLKGGLTAYWLPVA